MKTLLEVPSDMEVSNVEWNGNKRILTIHHRVRKNAKQATAAYLTTQGDGGREIKEVLLIHRISGEHAVQKVEGYDDTTEFDRPSDPQVDANAGTKETNVASTQDQNIRR